jgi:hypothetical protein
MPDPTWTRRIYTVRNDDDMPFARAEVLVRIGGRVHTQTELRNPGMIALVCRPGAPHTFHVEIVEPKGGRFTDVRLPDREVALLPWHRMALEVG